MRYRFAAFLCVVFLLAGCKGSGDSLNRAMALRNKFLESNGCRFQTTVTADYGEQIYVFKMDCQTDRDGNLSFSVTEPETIAGIAGKISASGGAITFDDKVLAFQTVAQRPSSRLLSVISYPRDCRTSTASNTFAALLG